MIVVNYIAFILLAIGGLNWGLIGFFNYNLVSAIFGEEPNIYSSIVYILVFASMLWLLFSVIYNSGVISFTHL
jgi:uncharacterized protein